MKWTDRLADPTPILLDGATGTRLEALGVDVRHPLWSSSALLTEEGRALTARVHCEYAAAGAELVIANTHNLSTGNVERWWGQDPKPDLPSAAAHLGSAPSASSLTRWLNAEAVALAQTAGPMVAGCLASPDRPYATRAGLTADEVALRLAVQYDALIRAAPDLIIFEMLTTDADIEGVAMLVERAPPPMPVAFGLVAAAPGDGGTLGGVTWPVAGRRLAPLASALFVQCTPVGRVGPALAALRASVPETVLGCYANDGTYDHHAQAWCGPFTTPEDYAAAAQRWCAAGARIIGGCCGTRPAHIAVLRRTLTPSKDRPVC